MIFLIQWGVAMLPTHYDTDNGSPAFLETPLSSLQEYQNLDTDL